MCMLGMGVCIGLLLAQLQKKNDPIIIHDKIMLNAQNKQVCENCQHEQ